MIPLTKKLAAKEDLRFCEVYVSVAVIIGVWAVVASVHEGLDWWLAKF